MSSLRKHYKKITTPKIPKNKRSKGVKQLGVQKVLEYLSLIVESDSQLVMISTDYDLVRMIATKFPRLQIMLKNFSEYCPQITNVTYIDSISAMNCPFNCILFMDYLKCNTRCDDFDLIEKLSLKYVVWIGSQSGKSMTNSMEMIQLLSKCKLPNCFFHDNKNKLSHPFFKLYKHESITVPNLLDSYRTIAILESI